jgi:hypothetical protein
MLLANAQHHLVLYNRTPPTCVRHSSGISIRSLHFRHCSRRSYEDLVKSCRLEWCAAHLFDCWIPDPERRKGLEKLPSGYFRLNFDGRDVQVHVFTFLYWKPGHRVELDISHLCGNPSCCNPAHLCEEDRDSNLKRRFCPGGILWDSSQQSTNSACVSTSPDVAAQPASILSPTLLKMCKMFS